jgi:hypothetical protein
VGNCNAKTDLGAIANSVYDVIDPNAGDLDLRRARRDPRLEARNLALGGATLRDVIEGSSGVKRLLERIEVLPEGDPGEWTTVVPRSQLVRLVELDADLGFTGDLLANDIMPALTGDDVDLAKTTDVLVVARQLDTIVDALGALHGHYFIGNLFDATALPSIAGLRDRRVLAREDTPESFDAKVGDIRKRIEAYNAALAAGIARHPKLHLVDLASEATTIEDGVVIDGERLTGRPFGGLLSLDHMHFSDTGYAIFANIFVREINRVLKSSIPSIDVAAVHRSDPFSAANLGKAGVHCP